MSNERIEFGEDDLTELDKGEYSYSVPVGPTHVALHEPLRFFFEVEGEKIRDVDIKPGWTHVGVEKIATKRNTIQIAPLVQRVCGICSNSHSFAYSRAMEDAAGVEVPVRAQYIRVIMQELERIHSHLLWAGSAGHEIGFESLFYYIWKEREEVMDLLEKITGNRVNYEMFIVGGVRRNITNERKKAVKKAIAQYEKILSEVKQTILNDPTVKARTKNVGVLTKEDAIKLSSVGPVARASGLKKDVRYNQPHAAYADIEFKPITPEDILGELHKDVYDRVAVRIQEVKQSISIIRYCLKNMPSGPIKAYNNMNALLSNMKSCEGRGTGRVEAPRGELIHHVEFEENEEKPLTYKIRTPTYGNLLSLIPMLLKEQIADIPIVGASIDPCISCLDRVTVIDKDKKEKRIYKKEELLKINKKKNTN